MLEDLSFVDSFYDESPNDAQLVMLAHAIAYKASHDR